jgi:uncharacterized membrane protein
MKACILAGLVLLAFSAPASACNPTLLSVFPDVKEIAKCVESHQSRIALQGESLERWMALHEKLATLVFQQQDEISKLRQEMFELKTTAALRDKKKSGPAR